LPKAKCHHRINVPNVNNKELSEEIMENSHLKLSSKTLAYLAQETELMPYVASHHSTSDKTLIELFKSADDKVLERISLRKNLSAKILSLFVDLPRFWNNLLIHSNKMPTDLLMSIFKSNNLYAKWKISQMKLPVRIAKMFIREGNPNYLFNIAYGECPDSDVQNLVSSKMDRLKNIKSQITECGILILSADSQMRELFKDAFDEDGEYWGYKNVYLAGSEDEALKITEQNQIDLIIAEQWLPDKTSDWVIRQIKAGQQNLLSIIIASSAQTGANFFIDLDIDHVFWLPIRIFDELCPRIYWMLGNKIMSRNKA